MMCFGWPVLPSKAEPSSCRPHLGGTLSVDNVITSSLYCFLNLALFDDPTCTSPRKPPISLNVSHEGQYLQVVTISSFILELQTVNVSHLLHHRHFEVWHVSLKTRRASPLCLARCPAHEPCQDHPGRVPERVRPKVLFTSCHGFGGETVHQAFG